MKQPLQIPHLAGREKSLRELGLSPTDATWLTLVCYHSGVFTRRQYSELHQCHRMAAHRLVRRLIAAGLARERLVPGTSLKVTHVHGRILYRALGIEKDVRHHRAARSLVLLRRLLCLDLVAEHPSLPWLPTELDKVAYFFGRRGFFLHDFPQRTYGGALKDTRRYFHHQLPIAADDHAVTFLYADPGRDSQTELRSWVDSHRRLWVRLREAGTRVHVAVVTRTLEAWSDYRRTLDRWLSLRRGGGSFSGGASTPGEQQVLDLIYAALRSDRPTALDPWGDRAGAHRIADRLLRRRAARGVPIDSYSTHHADRLAPDSLAR